VAEHYRRGLELAELGEQGAARAEWTRAATLDRDRASLFEALALAAAVHHVYPEGVRWANRAADLLPRTDPLRTGYLRLGFPAVHYGRLMAEAMRHQVEPERLWAIIRQESLYDPLAVSGAGALGLMQILPATLRRIVREEGLAPLPSEALFRPALNLALGSGFFADRLEEFDYRLLPTLAAYNAGEGKARQWLEAADGDSDEVFVECIGYPETQGYVRRIVWLIWVYRSYYGGDDLPARVGPEAR
jgi:soluble lytic murein transglycosylase